MSKQSDPIEIRVESLERKIEILSGFIHGLCDRVELLLSHLNNGTRSSTSERS